MITLMCIIYTAFVVLIFKLKILKPRPYPIAWSAVGGVLVIGAIVAFWRLDAPMSGRVVTTQYVVQLVPYVKGQIKKVVAKANQPIKKGAVLVEVDTSPYQDAVNQLQAQLAGAKDNVKQSEAGLQAAKANVAKAKAGVMQARAGIVEATAAVVNATASVAKAKALDELSRTEEMIALKLQKSDAGAISELKVAEAVQKRQANDAALKQTEAGLRQVQAGQSQADAGLEVAISSQAQAEAAERQAGFGIQVATSNVSAVKSQLNDALFNLAQCTMYAPADGYIVDWQVQEGSWVAPVRAVAIGTFIVTGEVFVIAVFPQNYLMNVKAGDEVEVILDPYPGQLFKAKVDTVITATGEGQFAPSKTMPEASQIRSHGLLAVKIILNDPPPDLPLGAGGTVAIYTDHGKPVHVISKVTLRMKKWMLFVVPS